jgi:hypothetical protein
MTLYAMDEDGCCVARGPCEADECQCDCNRDEDADRAREADDRPADKLHVIDELVAERFWRRAA